MTEITIGIGGFLGHDANAALMIDGHLVAASQEERFSRVKHDARFPEEAIRDCLSIAGIGAGDVSAVVFAEKPFQTRLFDRVGLVGPRVAKWLSGAFSGRYGREYVDPAQRLFPTASTYFAWHHLSHVAGAYYTSDIDRAAFLCVDGKGENLSASIGVIDEKELEMRFEQPFENGLGLFYTLVTHFLGFPSFGSEYKVMGLAPYGTPRFVDELDRLLDTDGTGFCRLRKDVKFRFDSISQSTHLVAEATGVAPRASGASVSQDYADVAASIQAIFEREVMRMAEFARKATGESALLFAGGCAQNCVTAGKLRASGIFDQVFNSPVGGDMGTGLGAALLYQRERGLIRGTRVEDRGYYLGSEPGDAPHEADTYKVEHDSSIHRFVAGQIADGKIVAWCRGRMELGARALGARSILADPRVAGMQSRLNLAVKFRESFRPFAPAILEEETDGWFRGGAPSRYMQFVSGLNAEHRLPTPEIFRSMRERLDFERCRLPSVVHVDFSARVQTVNRETHPDFYELLTQFRALTGIPIMINTSFNVSGQPIVRTAQEAWDCFVHTDIDLLVIGEEVFRNPNRLPQEDKQQWVRQFAASA